MIAARAGAVVGVAALLWACDAEPERASDPCRPDPCAPHERCDVVDEDPRCAAVCPVPEAPTLTAIDLGAALRFTVATAHPGDHPIEVAVTSDASPPSPERWSSGDTLAVAEVAGPGEGFTAHARSATPPPGCADVGFAFTYLATDAGFAPAAGEPDSSAIAADDPAFAGWAAEIVDVRYGEGVDAAFRTPERALGPAGGGPLDVVSLGDGGTITVRFEPPIADGPGPDLAVFENAITDTFLELGRVEVSSDGHAWARFDAASLVDAPVPQYGALDPTRVHGLAGKYRAGFGAPFDLDTLREKLVVRTGRLDLGRVAYVRVADVIGDGREVDAFGRPIYDPFPTVGSAGFDLDAIGALHVAPD